MPKARADVHQLLQELSGYGQRVYFNPPESLKMQYPCIVYSRVNLGALHADNFPYFRYDTYTVTHIYQKESESSLSDRLALESGFSFDRNYIADNLRHDVFTYKIY